MDSEITIIGPRKLQNELLARYILSTTGFLCRCLVGGEDLGLIIERSDDNTSLILWDSLETDLESVWIGLGALRNYRKARCHGALFNMSRDSGIECEAIEKGLMAVFYDDDPLHLIAKGVKTTMNGEMWFPREKLFENIIKNRNAAKTPIEAGPELTFRESQILTLVASGVLNRDIADRLCISRFTVKTHLHNIYKKIDVPNRFEALKWASGNL